jgi:hypothetical protein
MFRAIALGVGRSNQHRPNPDMSNTTSTVDQEPLVKFRFFSTDKERQRCLNICTVCYLAVRSILLMQPKAYITISNFVQHLGHILWYFCLFNGDTAYCSKICD